MDPGNHKITGDSFTRVTMIEFIFKNIIKCFILMKRLRN
jgi:hypothetical protein